MTKRSRKDRRRFLRRHGLSLGVLLILGTWVVLYTRSDPQTHLGAFYGNAIADWLGSVLIVVSTKYFYELGSDESRPPHPASRRPVVRFMVDHSLTIFIVVTGVMWAVAYARIDSNGKAGQVIGNIVSEWIQVLGLVVMTKYLGEIGSKESS